MAVVDGLDAREEDGSPGTPHESLVYVQVCHIRVDIALLIVHLVQPLSLAEKTNASAVVVSSILFVIRYTHSELLLSPSPWLALRTKAPR